MADAEGSIVSASLLHRAARCAETRASEFHD
jgi:hypothetical protein